MGAAGAQGGQARGSSAGLAASEGSEYASLGGAKQGGKVSKGPMGAAWLSGQAWTSPDGPPHWEAEAGAQEEGGVVSRGGGGRELGEPHLQQLEHGDGLQHALVVPQQAALGDAGPGHDVVEHGLHHALAHRHVQVAVHDAPRAGDEGDVLAVPVVAAGGRQAWWVRDAEPQGSWGLARVTGLGVLLLYPPPPSGMRRPNPRAAGRRDPLTLSLNEAGACQCPPQDPALAGEGDKPTSGFTSSILASEAMADATSG